jgi:hypothetical protein
VGIIGRYRTTEVAAAGDIMFLSGVKILLVQVKNNQERGILKRLVVDWIKTGSILESSSTKLMVGHSDFSLAELSDQFTTPEDFVNILLQLHVDRLVYARNIIEDINKTNQSDYKRMSTDEAIAM